MVLGNHAVLVNRRSGIIRKLTLPVMVATLLLAGCGKEEPASSAAPASKAETPAQQEQAQHSGGHADQGKAVYDKACKLCHDMGVANAPKLGDNAAWESRVAKGMEALYNSAINGLNAMPAKGGNAGLSDGEVKDAVSYMVAQVQ